MGTLGLRIPIFHHQFITTFLGAWHRHSRRWRGGAFMRQLFGLGLGIGVMCWLATASSCFGQEEDKKFQERIDLAVKKGVDHLQSLQQPDGTWRYANYTTGTTALAVWTLFESGVAKEDKGFVKGLEYIRQRALSETNTYNISLMIILFDRLGEEQDVPLIESLGVRLLAGQTRKGGWGYQNPGPSPAEIQRLSKKMNSPPADLVVKEDDKDKQRTLSAEVAIQVAALKARAPNQISDLSGDNSNTQFAMIALWVSQKYGIPVEDAMKKVGQRFQATQWPDGSWKYEFVRADQKAPIAPHQTPAMTCAGLLGLALGHAVDPDNAEKSLLDDPQVMKGMEVLYDVMKNPGKQGLGYTQKQYYYLWSLERVAVVYNIAKIKDMDWYRWGAELILARQATDGSWAAQYGVGGVDTCFALLFLKRVNVVEDLTTKIAKVPPKKPEDPRNPFIELVPIVVNPNAADPKKPPVANPKIDPKIEPKKEKPKPLFPKSSSSADPYSQSVRQVAFWEDGREGWFPRSSITLGILPGRERFPRLFG
jgi:hypothetical protein